MTAEELRETFTDQELVKMWCRLNSFEWPEALSDRPWNTRADGGKLCFEQMVLIERAIGNRACLAEWNRSRR